MEIQMCGDLLEAKHEHIVRKMEKGKYRFILISAGMKFGNKNKLWYSIPAYNSPF
jgi:hypothetical protein